MSRRFFTVLVLICLTPGVRGEDWPEFRGPDGQGHAMGILPTEWGPMRNLVWKQALPGNGWSSPAIVGGRIYLTASVVAKGAGGGYSLQALCLNATSGKSIWEREVFQEPANAPRPHGKNSHASPTPLVAGDRLYVHFGHQGTACLDLAGKVLWTNTEQKYSPVHGNGGTPILVDDALVFSCDGGDKTFVVALDRNTGKQLWKTDRTTQPARGFSFSTPLLITVKGQKQIVSAGSDAVMAYDPATGKELWKVRYEGGYSVIPRPVFGHGLVFVCTGYGTPNLLAIRVEDATGDVTETNVVWKSKRNVPHTPSLLLVDYELYMVSDGGQASCLDARTGKVHWQERLERAYSASPLYADGKIYFQSEDGVGTVVKASKEFVKVATNPLKERTLASYAAVDGALFIRTEGNLYRFQSK
jgi:outer membrane protein assembly factor BamB